MTRFAHRAGFPSKDIDLAFVQYRYIIAPAALWAVALFAAVVCGLLTPDPPAAVNAARQQQQQPQDPQPMAEPIGGLAFGA